ncbi:helix-turn-helix domain-containing protein [Dyadobacter sp. CY261]|uniref:helix-turn-helix domain-containing protein n=1 Tax=Dyadobacter sp. CY261 TaxID=2907203 RepID=UPI001F1E00B2|nr:helix-turn-helix transcriptional regulator [Dyadobacter sp. CY261]MCF0070674.1 helix-turn-helix domain-containing protein [Dyadobacter sp. CY261]
MEAFARNLRAKREGKGYSVTSVASSLGINEEQYNELETGRTDPSVNTLKRLSEILHTTVPDLISDRPVQELISHKAAGQFSAESLNDIDKDTYIKILENQLRLLLAEKKGV